MWDELFVAVALLFVFEGMMPFVSPTRWRIVIRTIADQSDTALRIMGLSSMLMGVVLLYVFR